MKSLIRAAHTFVQDENGVTAIEYGLIAAMVAAGLSVAIVLLTDGLTATFTKIKGVLTQ
ncbi:Flp family type IVb pilin [Massilia sp. TS11]|uniref:Flp family type IVb pilin n=1 Tax=Massilia sp. TS11 TaxID=2908003 RepID=UPI001EDB1B46|nr:Flp family type IVb pilin [Massilia sp. TS11]MCG2585804.1 Flp family type IVb pilin [Massilia sp. TS11]